MEELKDPEIPATVVIESDVIQHLNNPVVGLKPIVKKYLGAVNKVVQDGNKFYFSDVDAKVEVVIISDDIIRVRLAPHGVFLEEFSYAVNNLDQTVSVFSLHLLSGCATTSRCRKPSWISSSPRNRTLRRRIFTNGFRRRSSVSSSDCPSRI